MKVLGFLPRVLCPFIFAVIAIACTISAILCCGVYSQQFGISLFLLGLSLHWVVWTLWSYEDLKFLRTYDITKVEMNRDKVVLNDYYTCRTIHQVFVTEDILCFDCLSGRMYVPRNMFWAIDVVVKSNNLW